MRAGWGRHKEAFARSPGWGGYRETFTPTALGGKTQRDFRARGPGWGDKAGSEEENGCKNGCSAQDIVLDSFFYPKAGDKKQKSEEKSQMSGE